MTASCQERPLSGLQPFQPLAERLASEWVVACARALRLAWFGLVCPSLMLNYFGQGALTMRDAAAVSNPFFLLVPDGLTMPLVI